MCAVLARQRTDRRGGRRSSSRAQTCSRPTYQQVITYQQDITYLSGYDLSSGLRLIYQVMRVTAGRAQVEQQGADVAEGPVVDRWDPCTDATVLCVPRLSYLSSRDCPTFATFARQRTDRRGGKQEQQGADVLQPLLSTGGNDAEPRPRHRIHESKGNPNGSRSERRVRTWRKALRWIAGIHEQAGRRAAIK